MAFTLLLILLFAVSCAVFNYRWEGLPYSGMDRPVPITPLHRLEAWCMAPALYATAYSVLWVAQNQGDLQMVKGIREDLEDFKAILLFRDLPR